MSHNFDNSHPVIFHTVRHSRGMCRNTDPSIWLFWRYRFSNMKGFLLPLSFPPFTILTLMLRTYSKYPYNSQPFLTKSCVCFCLENIIKETSQQFGVLNFPDFYLDLNICMSLRLQRRNWYIFILLSIFIVVTPSFLW